MTRKICIVLFLVISSGYLLEAQDSLYFKGNELYRSEAYEEAIAIYEKLVVAGYESPALYYNLGNACFRSNKLGKARLYYEKALKLDPGDEDARANLSYLSELLTDRFEEVPVIFYKKWIRSAVVSLSSDSWAVLSVITFLLSSAAFLAYLFFRDIRLRKTGFYSFIFLLLSSLFSFGASWKQYRLKIHPESAVVTELMVNARSAPHESGTELFVLHEGAKVFLEDNTGGWQEIRLSDGRKGWVPSETVQPV